ncbi:hypothetical protein [Bacillus phage Anath]|uniref:HNH nuclease domain-containing protein n=1 Tax=Bacillus phage Anath TaxID=2108114 RepID=A0A2P1JUL5_9CAUD|nr:hypothetical protein [Bacillus phage Anath]
MEIVITQKDDTEHTVLLDDDFQYNGKIYMNKGYASIWMNNKHVPLHRYVMGVHNGDSKIVVDHINHNTLDNRKSNLRLCSTKENVRNTRSKGYSFDKFTGKYKAVIMVDRKYINLGRYDTTEEAQKVYREAHVEHFGEFSPYWEAK